MNRKQIFIIGLLISLCFALESNGQYHRCGHIRTLTILEKEQPGYSKAIEQSFSRFNSVASSIQRSFMDTIIIPVHVIIVHPPGENIGQGSNLSLARIQSQIAVINEDFRRQNADAINTPDAFPTGDAFIEFALAQIDPQGNMTNGITRYPTNEDFDEEELAIKDATRWDRDTYLNIWVAPTLDDLGFAYLPGTLSLPNESRDGCAVLTFAFGGPGFATSAPYNLGRTATHEIGHYLGLRHVWRNDGCGSDDGISDTPLQDTSHFGCPTHPMPSCGNDGDMFMNYMDYVDDDCMNAFSAEQIAYMRQILNTSRSSLLTAADRALTGPPEVLSLDFAEVKDPDCFDTFTGRITVNARGGAGNYRVRINSGPSQSSPTFEFLKAGNYSIQVFDNLSNSIQIDTVLIDPPLLEIATLNAEDPQCFTEGGSVSINASGGSVAASYEYELSDGQSNDSGVFENLPEGDYEVTVKDDRGCEDLATFSILSPDTLSLRILDQVNIDCENTSGSVLFEGQGGTGSLNYFLDGVALSGPLADQLEEGMYTLAVVDENSCTIFTSFTIEEIEGVSITNIEEENPECSGEDSGSISVEVGQSDGAMFALEDGMLQNSPIFDHLSAGTYTVYAYAGACVDSIEVVLEEGRKVDVQLTILDTNFCPQDQQASIQLTSSNTIIQYTLNGLDQSVGLFEGLASGLYTATLEDDKGCSQDTSFEILAQSDLAIILEKKDISCFQANDGFLVIQGENGLGPYEYSINGTFYSSNNAFFGYGPGQFQAFIRDEEGCIVEESFEVIEPDSLYIQEVNEFINGDIEVLAVGGTFPYTYSLDDLTYQESPLFTSNTKGDVLSLYVKDANDCTASFTYVIVSNEELALKEGVKIFPNPARSTLFLDIDPALSPIESLSIRAMDGTVKQVFNSSNTQGLSIEGLPAGLYYLQLVTADAQAVFRFVKMD